MLSSAAMSILLMKSPCLSRSRISLTVACSNWWLAWTSAQALTGAWPTSTVWQPAICGIKLLSALVDRNDAPATLETIDPRHRERIDDKTQRAVGIKIKRDGERGADRAGMHDEHDIARGQWCQPRIRAGNLIDKTFAAGGAGARRRFPEILVGVAELGNEVVVPPSGPGSEILFAKVGLFDWIEPKGDSGFPCPARRAANRKSIFWQSCLQCGEGRGVADISRRVRTVDDAARPVDRGVPDQPQICLGAHRSCLDHDPIRLNRIMISSFCWSMLSGQTLRVCPEGKTGSHFSGSCSCQPRGEQHENSFFFELSGATENIAGLAADLPLRQPCHADRHV